MSEARPPRDHGFHQLRVSRVVNETDDAVTLAFDIPENLAGTFAYQAGQFCNLRVPIADEMPMRCYSMSSSPVVDDELRVTIKRVPGGLVSNWIADNVLEGQTVDVAPPTGFFQLTATTGDLVGFAAGSGITPVFSLVKTALATTDRRVLLHYANRDRRSVIFGAEIDELEERYGSRLTVVRSFDEEDGFVRPEAVTQLAATSAGSGEFYVCGPGPYMNIVEEGLVAAGVEPTRLHIERFTAAELLEDALLADTTEASEEPPGGIQVTIVLDGRTETTEYHPGTTVLQTARSVGMSPPFSCEAGSCATCMARLVEGEVTMHTNNALTPEEVAEGWVLTCQSVPTSSTVRIVYGFEEA